MKNNWEETVLSQEDIVWRYPKLTYIDDGKLDVQIKIPLTELFRKQAKYSFSHGVVAGSLFIFAYMQHHNNQFPDLEEIKEKFTEWGISIDV